MRPLESSIDSCDLGDIDLHHAHLALGSNVGDRKATLRRSLAMLDDPSTLAVKAVSSFHDTDPVDSTAGSGRYLNAAAAVTTTLGPWELLGRLMAVELALGRRRPDRLNAPRPIDLDLLLYDDLVLADPRLTLPHPRMHERAFVLAPLAEVAADRVHPTLRRTVGDLLARSDRG